MPFAGILMLGLLAGVEVEQGGQATPPPCVTKHSTLLLTTQMVSGAAVGAWRATHPPIGPAVFSGEPRQYLPHFKGELAEQIFEKLILRGWFEETGWQAVTPARIGRSGIDLLFVKLGPNGEIVDTLVVESKFGTSRLGRTAVGPQMSEDWVRSHMRTTSTLYRKLAQEVSTGGLVWSDRLPGAGTEVIQLPLEKGRNVYLWQDHPGRVAYSVDGGDPGVDQVRRALYKIGDHCSAVGEGRLRYRGTIARYSVDQVAHKITIGGRVVCEGPFDELPLGIQRSLRQAITGSLRKLGYSGHAVSLLVDEYCRQPAETWRWIVNQERWNARVGLGSHLLATGAVTGVATGGMEMLAEFFTERTVDIKRVGSMALMGAGVGMAADYTATQAVTLLTRTEIGQQLAQASGLAGIGGSVVVSAGAGMLVAGIAFPCVEYAMGYIDQRTAYRLVVVNTSGAVVGVATGAAAWWAVSTFGTASTGTAIGSLSGAAATNATLAWFGGGSIAAGGLGVTGGAVVLTGGVALVAVATSVAIATWWHYADLAEKRQLLAARIELVKKTLEMQH